MFHDPFLYQFFEETESVIVSKSAKYGKIPMIMSELNFCVSLDKSLSQQQDPPLISRAECVE
jgi:hypothetical protein